MKKFVEFIEINNQLKIELIVSGQEIIDAISILKDDISLIDIIEYQLCNGWDFIRPEEIGALTNAPILSNEVKRDDNGEITEIGKIYWFADYQMINEVESLLFNDFLIFDHA